MEAGIMIVIGLLAFGGIAAAGCGGDDSTSHTTLSAEDTDATTTTEGADTTVTSTEGDAGEGASPEAVYEACTGAISGTPAEAAGEAACGQARDAFQKCIDTAATLDGDAKDQALQACHDAADQAIAQLSGQ
ncbi:MAG: hypothetical protein EDQ89_05625 [Acidobacteria bacterium]|nr:MAG: hypothetical protein EDQ89_05625 [Acidobacteriota bacterium]MCL4286697.1 hypothetical protein [Thermoleophilia bacterium]